MKLSHLTAFDSCIFQMDLNPPTYLLWSLGELHEAACSFWWFAAAATLTTFLVLNPSERKQMKDKLWAKNPGWKSEHPSSSDRREISDLSFRTTQGTTVSQWDMGTRATAWDCRSDKKRRQGAVNARGEFCHAGERGLKDCEGCLFHKSTTRKAFVKWRMWKDFIDRPWKAIRVAIYRFVMSFCWRGTLYQGGTKTMTMSYVWSRHSRHNYDGISELFKTCVLTEGCWQLCIFMLSHAHMCPSTCAKLIDLTDRLALAI